MHIGLPSSLGPVTGDLMSPPVLSLSHLGWSPCGVLINTAITLPGWVLWVLGAHSGHLTFR